MPVEQGPGWTARENKMENRMYFWLRQELKEWQSISVCLSLVYILSTQFFTFLSKGLFHCLSRVSGSALLAYFVDQRQTEPKILRLVYTHFLLVQFTNKSYVSK